MPSFNPPIKNVAYTFYASLRSRADSNIFQANPTLAAGDVKVAVDDGAPANLATLPAVDADFTKRVKVSLSAAEMNGDNISIIFSDAAGAEWVDLTVNIQTVPAQITFNASGEVVSAIESAAAFAQGAADKVWVSATRTLTSLGTAAALEVWNALRSSMTAAGSIGLRLKNLANRLG